MKKKYSISVITCTFNRKKSLRKLIKSLERQTYKNFVWLVADDGSTDGTDELIMHETKKKKLKTIFFRSDLRIGKAKLENILIKNIKSDLVVWCDSDDFFLPDSLKKLESLFHNIPYKNKKNFAGVVAQNIDTMGNSQSFKYPEKIKNYDYLSYEKLQNKVIGDATFLAFSKIYRNKKFLEVDFVINEGSLLNNLFKKKKFILINNVVKIMDRNANLSVSFGDKLQYCKGSAYCISKVDNFKNFKKKNYFSRLSTIIKYWRYSFHGDIKLFKAKKLWGITKKNSYTLLLWPLSFAFIMRDILLNKVEKTHIEFNKNIRNYKITKKKLF